MEANNPITRLTEREKEALRAWLDHKSAKEIALDLGITHHAVEKRLKMARTKLGARSSLEAARMLAEADGAAEGYGQAVTTAPDLAPPALLRPTWRHRPIVFGAVAMSLALVLALAFTSGVQPSAADEDLAAVTAAASAAATPTEIEIEIEIDGRIDRVFAYVDADKSGFLEDPESPFVTVEFAEGSGTERVEGSAVIGDGTDPKQVAEFYADADADKDGRISLAEYAKWSEAHWAEMGIEIKSILKVIPSPQS
ncbi:MAG: LuxR C-terminal-related transcriptional regulator [Erythrobacter sp.]|uniref:LuxR C-terminal-related transcriptional regulator n=1 Tax=Erythrobacter sp. TaxID=1042 RepID=UPI0025E59100|nr:LuxR C-terminal-related transcriptional regulator [Erythrobacter sp.]MCL9997894.1 LuxR C-terminal-related transcriptional regulator [Erythrobacter sp.]